MLNAEYLLAKDPDNLEFIALFIKAAVEGEYFNTAEWIADIYFDAAKAANKNNPAPFMFLKDQYSRMKLYDKSLQACSYAVKLKPNDGALADELKNLSANLAVQRGRYEEDGDFRKSIKDRKSQAKLQAQEAVIKSADFKTGAVSDAKKAYSADPDNAMNVKTLANALADMENDKSTAEAVKILNEAHGKTSDFSFKRSAGEITIKSMRRKARQAKASLEANPNDDSLREKFRAFAKEIIRVETEHYKGCVDNYPTDLKLKYEYGTRLLQAKRYDEAIPMFQDARHDPKNKIPAMDKVGICFFNKGWFTDSIDIFNEAIKGYDLEDDNVGKELRYNLARAYEKDGQLKEAYDLYRKLAQLDFGYRDVRNRVDKLRKSGKIANSQ
jgi:tetratricopeptide (TPR) repeat protein